MVVGRLLTALATGRGKSFPSQEFRKSSRFSEMPQLLSVTVRISYMYVHVCEKTSLICAAVWIHYNNGLWIQTQRDRQTDRHRLTANINTALLRRRADKNGFFLLQCSDSLARAFPVAGLSICNNLLDFHDFSSYCVYVPSATENLSVFSLLHSHYTGPIDLTSSTVIYITWTTLKIFD